jgi:DNA-binding GntR family transcriptional regulator
MGLRAVTSGPGRPQEVLDERTAIVDALRELDADRAVAAVKVHLDNTLTTLRHPATGAMAPPWSPT